MAWVNAIIQGILTGGLYALFACGLSLMFGVMKVVNLAHGDLAILGGYIALGVITVTHVPVLWSVVIVVPIMAVLGYVMQRTMIQASLDRSVLTTLLVTFGLSVVIENGLLQFLNADSHSLGVGNSIITKSFSLGSQIQIAYLLVLIFAVAVAVLLGLQYFLSSSRYGRMIRAVADDREAAQLSGVSYDLALDLLDGGPQVVVAEGTTDAALTLQAVGDGVALHLVRYDYDPEADRVPVLDRLVLEVRLPFEVAEARPASPDGALRAAAERAGDGRTRLVLGAAGVYGIVHLVAGAPR